MSSAQLKKFASVKPADIQWRDNLPFSREFDDVYYSNDGALEESEYVFLKGCQLETDWKNKQQSKFFVAELGFGSGLNFFNTASLWRNKVLADQERKHLHYISIEKRPFSIKDFIQSCQNWPQFEDITSQLIEQYPSTTYGRHQFYFKELNLTLTLFFMPVEDALADLQTESQAQQNKIEIDHWFLDGFSPSRNSSMWGEKIMQAVASLSKSGSRLATFSVASAVKKPIADAGFKISKLKGFGRKREMLTAQLEQKPVIQQSKFINIKYESPWFNHCKSEHADSVAIIGGGIAGCATAYSLAEKGLNIELFESHQQLAAEASGAAAGIFHPQLTSDMNINSQFNWLGYCYLLRFLSGLDKREINSIVLSQGVNRFLPSAGAKQQLLETANKLNLGNWIKDVSDFSNNQRGIQFPDAATLNMPAFCQLLIDKIPDSQKTLHLNSQVEDIHFSDGYWQFKLDGKLHQYKHLIFCGGAKSNLLKTFIQWPTNRSRGQTCFLGQQQLSNLNLGQQITQTLCEKAYLVPRPNGDFHIGTTFEDFVDDQLNQTSQNQMLCNTAKLLKELDIPFLGETEIGQQPLSGTLGYRLHSLDRLPFVGGMPDIKKLNNDFESLGQKRIAREATSHYNQPGLWLNTAYGSHGLIYSLLASQHLASLICNDISPLSQPITQALQAIRFPLKQLKAPLKQ